MAKESVMVFTGEPHTTIVERGGTGNWRASANRVKDCEYVVLARNAESDVHKPDPEPHHTAFLVGRIVGSSPSKERDRIVIEFEEYAEINKLDAWPSPRPNPVAYLRGDELRALIPGIEKLNWRKLR